LPHVALLDVEMSEGNGYQACANIRMLPGGTSLPIVMVTGLDDPASIELAYEAGATDFVVKPLNWPLLAHRIRYVLRGARTIEALRVSEQKNAALLKAIPDGLLLVNGNGVIDRCFNPVVGLPEGPEIQHILDMIPKAAQGRAMECLAATLRGEPAEFEFSLDYEGKATRHLECRYLPNASGQVLAIVRDITERKETQAHIQRLAYYDALTGLPDRWPRHELDIAAWRSFTSTSTSSNASTTRSDTTPAMPCCGKLRSACVARWLTWVATTLPRRWVTTVRPGPSAGNWPAWAAMNSLWCSRASTEPRWLKRRRSAFSPLSPCRSGKETMSSL
jgi:PAS domain-containing protein